MWGLRLFSVALYRQLHTNGVSFVSLKVLKNNCHSSLTGKTLRDYVSLLGGSRQQSLQGRYTSSKPTIWSATNVRRRRLLSNEPVNRDQAALGSGALGSGQTVNVDKAAVKSMQEQENTYVIDVREPSEIQQSGAISGSLNIPLGEVEAALNMSPQQFMSSYKKGLPDLESSNIVFYCASGRRSTRALQVAKELGYKRLWNLEHGYSSWAEK